MRVVKVKRAVGHPDYDAQKYANEVAVLELAEEMHVDHMPKLYGKPKFAAKTLMVLGYGYTNTWAERKRLAPERPDYKLRRVQVRVLPAVVCGPYYVRACMKTDCICAGDTNKGLREVRITTDLKYHLNIIYTCWKY